MTATPTTTAAAAATTTNDIVRLFTYIKPFAQTSFIQYVYTLEISNARYFLRSHPLSFTHTHTAHSQKDSDATATQTLIRKYTEQKEHKIQIFWIISGPRKKMGTAVCSIVGWTDNARSDDWMDWIRTLRCLRNIQLTFCFYLFCWDSHGKRFRTNNRLIKLWNEHIAKRIRNYIFSYFQWNCKNKRTRWTKIMENMEKY